MIKTTYTCDKCGHEQETKDQMWQIGVSVSHLGHTSRPGQYEKPKGEKLWCRKCIEGLGLLPANGGKDPEKTQLEPLSLEDMVREIVQDEISANSEL